MGFSLRRGGVLLGLLAAAVGGMSARVAYLQTQGRADTLARVEKQHHQVQPLQARRGSIFDRNGQLLAATVRTYTIFVDPKMLLGEMNKRNDKQKHGEVAVGDVVLSGGMRKLAAMIDMPEEQLLKTLTQRQTSRYVKLKEGADEAMVSAVRDLRVEVKNGEKVVKHRLPGLGWHVSDSRVYPMGSLAAHVLGGMSGDGKGLEGAEWLYERMLRGEDGLVRERRDAKGNPINVDAGDYLPPKHGRQLVLSIDANIQHIAEQELEATCKRVKASRGEVVVMDPHTGDVLALANWPTYSPAAVLEAPENSRKNWAVNFPYEPGSTIKPFIVGPALEAGMTRVDEVLAFSGPKRTTSYGRTITDVSTHSNLTVWDVMVKSSNIGMTLLADRMGVSGVYSSVRMFGFGKKTGIEVAKEDRGLVNPMDDWNKKYSPDSVVQGYEMMVTPLQLARAMSVYANGGRLVKPRLIIGDVNDSGEVRKLSLQGGTNDAGEVILSAETVNTMRQMMADVVIRGTGKSARSQVYNLFGKTGTARKLLPGGRAYDQTRYTSSFIGAGPVENPKVVVVMVVHEADKRHGYTGGMVSAPGAGRVMERTLAYMQVPASPEAVLPPPYLAAKLERFDPKVYARKGTGAEALLEWEQPEEAADTSDAANPASHTVGTPTAVVEPGR